MGKNSYKQNTQIIAWKTDETENISSDKPYFPVRVARIKTLCSFK